MADVWADVLMPCRFAGMTLDVLATSETISRAVARHGPVYRDGELVVDMGSSARTTECRILFFERPSEDIADPKDGEDHVARAKRFLDLANRGTPQDFTHPLWGTYPALVEDIRIETVADERDQVSISAVFIEQGLDPRSLREEVAAASVGGPASVNVEAQTSIQEGDALALGGTISDGQAADVEDVCQDSIDTVESWNSDPTISPRDISVGLQRLSTRISDLVDNLQLSAVVEGWLLFRALGRLHYQVRRAAAFVRQEAPALTTVIVTTGGPLRVILVSVYGASGVEAQLSEVVRINDIDDPTYISGGTSLVVPTPTPQSPARLRRRGPTR